MSEMAIDRIEKKYLITNTEKEQLLELMRRNMQEDSYHESEVQNLYFDNENFDLTVQSIDWVDFKEKVRARSYEGYDRVFLELKTKMRASREIEKHQEDEGIEDNVGYKRRVMITREDFERLLKHKNTLTELAVKSIESKRDLQIAEEIEYLLEHFELRPRIYVAYHRESYKDGEGLRVTFDEGLRFRDQNLSLKQGKHDKIYFKNERNIIMEIKAHGVIPLWLVKKMSELKIYPQQFSKIGKVYELIRKEQNV